MKRIRWYYRLHDKMYNLIMWPYIWFLTHNDKDAER